MFREIVIGLVKYSRSQVIQYLAKMGGVTIKEVGNIRREDGVQILSECLYSRQEHCSADVEYDKIVWETWRFVDGRSRRIEYWRLSSLHAMNQMVVQ